MRVIRVAVASIGIVLAGGVALALGVGHGSSHSTAQRSQPFYRVGARASLAQSCDQAAPSPIEVVSSPTAYVDTREIDLLSYVGQHWLLTRLVKDGQEVPLSTLPRKASLDFSTRGRFWIDDTVNATSGPFHQTGTTFTASTGSATLVGYAGSDQCRLAVIDALVKVASGPERAVLTHGRPQLIVTVAKYTLTFDWAGKTLQPAR